MSSKDMSTEIIRFTDARESPIDWITDIGYDQNSVIRYRKEIIDEITNLEYEKTQLAKWLTQCENLLKENKHD